MEYPRPVMSITEMVNEMGYPREYMNNVVHIPGQKFAFRTSNNGKWMIDTEAFERFRQRQQERAGRTGEIRGRIILCKDVTSKVERASCRR